VIKVASLTGPNGGAADPPTLIPEPLGVTLFGLALVGLGVLRRRRG
jgi:hypothetical protein